MKAQLHKLPLNSDTSFYFTRWDCKHFDKPWHFHEEYELVLIAQSRGTKFIGDAVSLFDEGDLILIGPNIPHLFRNDEEYYQQDSGLNAVSMFLHFTEDFLGKDFFTIPEMKSVRELLDRASTALQIHGKTKKQIVQKLRDMNDKNPAGRLVTLMEILIRLSESKELKPLLSTTFSPNVTTNSRDANRIHNILEFIMANYREQIYLSEIASRLNMSEASFSRYFKHHTGKTFSSYVTDVRISHACRLLMQGEENIAQVAYQSGFENLANFYRHFKKITGEIPKDYRKRFLTLTETI